MRPRSARSDHRKAHSSPRPAPVKAARAIAAASTGSTCSASATNRASWAGVGTFMVGRVTLGGEARRTGDRSIQPHLHGLIAGCRQDGVVVPNGCRREPLVEPLSVLRVDLMWSQLREHDRTERRTNREPQLAPVFLHRGECAGWFDLIEPGVKELADCRRRALDLPVENVRQQFRQGLVGGRLRTSKRPGQLSGSVSGEIAARVDPELPDAGSPFSLRPTPVLSASLSSHDAPRYARSVLLGRKEVGPK